MIKGEFEPGLNIGDIITNNEIMNIFRCSGQGTMRRSLKRNSLVLISNLTTNTYKDIFKEDGLWYFPAMGREENQRVEYNQNQTLYKSNENSIALHLFIVKEKGMYTYQGRVLLAEEPKEGYFLNSKIIMFPLLMVGIKVEVTNFFLDYNKNSLIENKIIDPIRDMLTSNNVFPLIDFMKEKHVDTLNNNGWFINKEGYFHNPYSSKRKMGNINRLLEGNLIKLNDVFKGQNKFINPFFKESSVYNAKKSIVPLTDTQNIKSSHVRIISLMIYDRDEDVNASINFGSQNQIGNNHFYTSLLIGPNGTGKSMTLSYIQKIFTDLYRLNVSKTTKIKKSLDYELIYILGYDTFIIKQIKGKIFFRKNEESVSLKELILPQKVISCAFTLQDRFSVLNEKEEQLIDQYIYLGIKKLVNKGQIKDSSSIIAKNIMLASLKDSQFLLNIMRINSYLGFEEEIKINFKLENGKTFDEIDDILLDKRQQNMSKKFKNSFSTLDLLNFIKRIRENGFLEDNLFHLNNESLSINFKPNYAKDYEILYDDFQVIQHLIDLHLFEKPSILMEKNRKWLTLEQASSGEFQYFSTMINILSNIEPNTLIILDEPETSLHPTWQYRYMSQLQDLFSKFPSCHFLIATHSHFMVADLKQEHSSIVTLTKNIENQVEVNLLGDMTFGRSIEDILYDVFDLPTNRNHYLASDLDDILLAISMEQINGKIREKVNKLKSVQKYLKETDPLRELIIKIIKEVENNV